MKLLSRISALVLAAVMAFALASCGDEFTTNEINNATSEQLESGQNVIEDVSVTYSSVSSAVEAVGASLTDDNKNSTLPSGCVSGVYEITSAGNYYFSGELTSAITVAKKSGEVHIYLDGVTLSTESASAISAKSGSYLTITLINDNYLSNSGEEKHVISTKENLVINGDGTLTINSTKSAIASDKTFIGLGGTINATAAKHCITADSIYIDGTIVNAVSCGKDVLHAESDYDEVETAPEFDYGKGFIYVGSGEINCVSVCGDGLQADSFVYITGGTFDLKTTPTWNDSYVATENKEKGMFSVSTHKKVARDSVRKGSTYAVLEESVKGIRVGEIDYAFASDPETEYDLESDKYTIIIDGGTFNINTVDDAIHANSGSVIINGGNLTINTSDDGIHADTNLKIGGSAVITVESSYEGIEAETIDISGGTTTITASDDGVNATNSDLSESEQAKICQINISGGRLDVTVSPSGDTDGIDSNGGIKITGGVVIARGPNSQNASPMDAANSISISGGTVVLIGSAPGSSAGFGGRGGMGGPGGMGGMGEGSLTIASGITKTQTSSSGLSAGNHTVTVGSSTISYYNATKYSGYTTVYASGTATIN
ncbi:MAG: carbohydrate-binding domain-containing protein [Clostridia bacterium]|nr:carbohydrate-binding domain-containing protein [Clostridia bacterium]